MKGPFKDLLHRSRSCSWTITESQQENECRN